MKVTVFPASVSALEEPYLELPLCVDLAGPGPGPGLGTQ